jgi:dihydrofolate synthase / folylpolyglutamate synthase
MSLAEEIMRIASQYPGRGPRDSLDAVVRLRERLGQSAPFPAIGIVGTNGKTSTATYLARLLTAAGARTGLYTSPHLRDWTERVRIDDTPCDAVELVGVLRAVHAVASSGDDLAELRFFDVLTLAAERLLAAAGVGCAVFEAGIGGRLDAIRALQPRVVILTSVALDHAEILGAELTEILAEKLLAAPRGGTVLSFRLGVELDEAVERIAAENSLRVVWVEPNPGEPLYFPTYLRNAFTLATRAADVVVEDLAPPLTVASPKPKPPWEEILGSWSPPIELELPGRFECGERDGVPYILDVGHNEAAWRQFAFEVHRWYGSGPETLPYNVLFSVSPGKDREELPDVLRSIPGLETAIVTAHTALPAEDPHLIAAELADTGIEIGVVEYVDAAIEAAFERARREETRLLVFGSTHLVADVRRWLSTVGAGSGE